jgi:uncharacterized protein YoxC
MGNDDRVLSQSEIDALLGNSLAKGNAPAATAPAPQQVKISAAPPPPKVVPMPPKAAAPPPPPPPKAGAAPVKPPTPAPASAPVPAPAPAPTPVPQQIIQQGPTQEQVTSLCKQLISEQTHDLTKQVIELTIKLNKLEGAAKDVAGMEETVRQVEEKIEEMSDLVKSSPKAVRALGSRIDEIYGLLESMKHQSEEGRIHDEFHCVKCHSEKLVAVHVKCTSCGYENWMGWFPDTADNDHGHY